MKAAMALWRRVPGALLLIACSLSACQHEARVTGADAWRSDDVWIASRDVKIPVTVVQPTRSEGPTPLVLLIHGHGGTRHEAGGFTGVAQGLAEAGISSIRMDFPGCGDSTEPFSRNNLANMMSDVRAAEDYAIARLEIDQARIGLLGFSMGGRVALLLSAENRRYETLGLWAPSAVNGAATMKTYLGGPTAYARMKAQAKADGFAPFTTFWGQEQQLGLQWFTDIEASLPADAVRDFVGDLFVLYGDRDTVIVPELARRVVTSAEKSRSVTEHILEGADHGLGLFNDDARSANEAIQATVRFFIDKLLR